MAPLMHTCSDSHQSTQRAYKILDIRSDRAGIELQREIIAGLKPIDVNTQKTLPTLLLYDEAGLRLFEQITYLDEYYLTNEEIRVLEAHADRIAERIPAGSIVFELGSGNLRKINILLRALDRAAKTVTYYALDLMHDELVRTLDQLPTYKHVQCHGLHGTYDDGLDFLKRRDVAERTKVILSMGSSIGNFPRDEAADFVRQFADVLGPHDFLLIGVDACQDSARVYEAYNDRQGITHAFVKNGLAHANRLYGRDIFDLAQWEVEGEYDESGGRHRAYVIPSVDVVVEGVLVRQGERVRIEESYKYNRLQAAQLLRAAHAVEGAFWSNPSGTYALHLIQRPPFMFSRQPQEFAATPIPSLDEWRDLWASWDLVTRGMIPDDQLLTKPIDLRNVCLFYLGHIPTFLDMKLVEATDLDATEPKAFHRIFERGIDPDVDNPEQCHAHSEIPEEWPSLDEILAFQERVRARIHNLYDSGRAFNEPWTGRTLWLGFEHEVMHLETLLYMLLQSDRMRAPDAISAPDFEQLATAARRDAVDNQWFDIPEQTLTIGLDDPDSPAGPARYFGWDVEKPQRTVTVPAFRAKARPITNEEYARYLMDSCGGDIPASWITTTPSQPTRNKEDEHSVNGVSNGHNHTRVDSHYDGDRLADFIRDKSMKTVYGPIPLHLALHWPVCASYDELAGCAKYMGGRIPTEEEARSIYSYAEVLKAKEAKNTLEKTIPAVNGHLINDGVEESPPSAAGINGTDDKTRLVPKQVHADLTDANVGFAHWHPMPVTRDGHKLAGLGEMGGLWEATSSPLVKQKGFVPMKLYPAYSADFYDGKHMVVLGGSWATHPRIAGRKTFVNWYQHNYPYAWIGGRLVQDV